MQETVSLDKIFVSDFLTNEKIINAESPEFLRQSRKQAIDFLNQNGLPDLRQELWRFTDIQKVMAEIGRLVHPFTPPEDVNTPIKDIFRCDINELDTYDFATINGWYPHSLPLIQKFDHQGIVGSLAAAFQLYPDLVAEYYGKLALNEEAFVALNTAFSMDGIFAFFPDNSKIQKPLQFVNLLSQKENALLRPIIQPRNLIIVGKNSDLSIVLCDHTLSGQPSFTNSLTEIYVGENATVKILRLQNQSNKSAMVSSLFVHQEANSMVQTNTITLNGGFTRNNQSISLDGRHARAEVYGLYLMDRQQHVDNNTFIEHNIAETSSSELFKGILDGKASGVFRGRILVRKDAQKIDSYQKNNTLLLTDDARINTMPQLEIYADDVKCSHGATVGYLGSDELFYLRSRGICEYEARIMLMKSFTSEITDKIEIPALHDRISMLVSKRLRGELSHCATCVLNCYD
ncbi:MAG TPA: Fe-S cluster assembly protein SufD [Bacteroidia bacterium]|nr:Fe-S cluster assembly protein SufD [Bacteroidia bacterium]HRS58421.1 Fe-S cluster assembly protein SufD [Bacteroidia bacterium]HRU68445.1 Fe-S cluster assembly protein SufD [Bacteroidia bacterium]